MIKTNTLLKTKDVVRIKTDSGKIGFLKKKKKKKGNRYCDKKKSVGGI